MKQASITAAQIKQRAQERLPPRPSEVIDRGTSFSFAFNGKVHVAFAGDTIASALAAAGIKVFSRSFKYHRPRGLLCCAGQCPNCLVQVGDEPNVRACMRRVEPGMQVRPQNAWPSLDMDAMSLTQWGDRFLPPGFYYKTFIRPRVLWPLYERVLRQIAGLGEIRRNVPRGEFDLMFLYADVAVIGAGPAGISAALEAAEQGAKVLLFDENPAAGGHLRFAAQDSTERTGNLPLSARSTQNLIENFSALSANSAVSNVTLYSDTTVLGCYKDNWLAAVQGFRLFKIRARSVVVATGAYENPLLFDNNDLPGVMLGSAAQRLLHLYGVAPGRRAVVVTANEDGWQVAADLHGAGVNVEAVVDEREREGCTSPHVSKLAATVPIFWGRTIVAARGTAGVTGALVGRVGSQGEVLSSSVQTLDCDLIAISIGWTPDIGLASQAGAECAYDEQRWEILPVSTPAGIYAAGRAAGTHDLDLQLAEGRLAGLSAAAFCGHGIRPASAERAALAARKAVEPRRTSTRTRVPGKKKRFLCYCEDVTDVDLETSIVEGYDNMELLKRYSTISMGPCQGKMCSMNAIHLCARANGWTVQQTGSTTSRPPAAPVKMGALAGQHMEPVQVTPVHEWHLEHGAKMIVAGLWLRPEHYGNPAAEVKAVRERAGLIDVSTLGKLRLTGPSVPDLLDRVYINNWRNLAVGRVRYGLMCSDEGVVLDDGVCAHIAGDEWYMTTTSSGADSIFEWIQWWAQSGWGQGVHVTNLTEAFAAINLAGPQSRAILQKITALDLSNASFPYMHVRPAEVAGVPCRLLRIGFTGELSYEIHSPSSYGLHLWEAIMAAGEEFGIAPFAVEAQRVLRLEKAHIIVSQDTDATSDPISANMDWAVKLDKPNFLGKRSLVRISTAGPRQRLVGFKMARPGAVPEEGLQIVAPGLGARLDIIGWVTSSRFSPTLGEAIGLCWLPADLASQQGIPFTIRMNDRLVEARVHHGPFYDPEGNRLRS